jgi:hypothetical protein
MNKFQAKAEATKRKLIASGEVDRIAGRAIAAARKVMAVGSHAIDASDRLASDNPMNRHIGSMIDDTVVSGKIAAEIELQSAATEIYKFCRFGNELAQEMRPALDLIDAVRAELGLTGEEV